MPLHKNRFWPRKTKVVGYKITFVYALVLTLNLPYSVKHWRKNFGESPTWEIKQKYRPPDASGGPGVKLWRISVNRGVPEYRNNLQNTAENRHSPVRPLQYTLSHAMASRKLLREHAVY